MEQSFHLLIKERGGTLFDDDVLSVTSFNDVGEFDVLPTHANFISLIKRKLIVREKDGEIKEFGFDNALMRVTNGFVEVYLGVEGVLTQKEDSL